MCEGKPYPAQLAVAGKLPTGQVGGTLVFFQYYVCSFRICREIELATHGGVSSGWSDKQQLENGDRKMAATILIELTFSVASHDVEPSEFAW